MAEMYGRNDWRNYLAHSWGKKPEQKKRESEYNHEYWEAHKEEIMRKRKKNNRGLTSKEPNVIGTGKEITKRGDSSTSGVGSKASFAALSKECLTDFGEFQAEMMENGYSFKDNQEARNLWKEYRQGNGVSTSDGEIVNAEKKLGERMTKYQKGAN